MICDCSAASVVKTRQAHVNDYWWPISYQEPLQLFPGVSVVTSVSDLNAAVRESVQVIIDTSSL